ncbi:MAG: rhodanese-like domain-containing protein [Pseudarcicella sp.]|nr:rhodanese-like domain-containing protein [Pseudarcicella sp.]MBP6410235.1 rhodanese-like domain-containing protein [Pseudarcicella sp.]
MDISVQELKQRMDANEKLYIIDVREENEYEEFNIGARLIPLGELSDSLDDLEELKEQEIIIHCRSGARSARAQEYLESLGFDNVRNLVGGMLAWQKEGF